MLLKPEEFEERERADFLRRRASVVIWRTQAERAGKPGNRTFCDPRHSGESGRLLACHMKNVPKLEAPHDPDIRELDQPGRHRRTRC